MNGVSLEFKIDDEPIVHALEQLEQAGADLTPAMDELGENLVQNVLDRFRTETGPGGIKWLASIRAKMTGGQTLTDKGHLQNSISHIAGNDQVEVGTNIIYAAIQQFGGAIKAKVKKALTFQIAGRWINKKSVTLPPRPFIGFDDYDRDDSEYVLSAHLRRALA